MWKEALKFADRKTAHRLGGLQNVVKERVGWGAADFVAFDCTSQEKAGSQSRGLRSARGVENSVKRGPKTAAIVPEMSVVL